MLAILRRIEMRRRVCHPRRRPPVYILLNERRGLSAREIDREREQLTGGILSPRTSKPLWATTGRGGRSSIGGTPEHGTFAVHLLVRPHPSSQPTQSCQSQHAFILGDDGVRGFGAARLGDGRSGQCEQADMLFLLFDDVTACLPRKGSLGCLYGVGIIRFHLGLIIQALVGVGVDQICGGSCGVCRCVSVGEHLVRRNGWWELRARLRRRIVWRASKRLSLSDRHQRTLVNKNRVVPIHQSPLTAQSRPQLYLLE